MLTLDRPGNMSDIFHTFFGISGLSLLGCFATSGAAETSTLSISSDRSDGAGSFSHYRTIDPTYALPSDVVESLSLPRQVLPVI